MRHTRTAPILIKHMKLPGDFSRRCLEPHVLQKAKSIEDVGMLHEPIVRKRNGRFEVISGLDRIASHVAAKKEEVLCKVYECTDKEARRIRQDENIHRRWDAKEREKLIKERLQEYVEEEEVVGLIRSNRGAPTTPRGRAIRRLCAELGMAEATLKRLDTLWRHRPPPPITTLGMDPDPEWYARVTKAESMARKASEFVHRGEEYLTLMAHTCEGMFPKERLQLLRSQLYQHSLQVEGLKPVSICPWCKGLDGLIDSCMACEGAGFITKGHQVEPPPELLNEREPMVVVDGEFRRVEDVAI